MLKSCSFVVVDSSLSAKLLAMFHPGWVSTAISNQMMGLVFVNTTDKEYKILEWPPLLSLGCIFKYYVYKSEDSDVPPGYRVMPLNGKFVLIRESWVLQSLPSIEELSQRVIDLNSS